MSGRSQGGRNVSRQSCDAITVEQMRETAGEDACARRREGAGQRQFRYLMARPSERGTRAKAATLHAISRRADKAAINVRSP